MNAQRYICSECDEGSHRDWPQSGLVFGLDGSGSLGGPSLGIQLGGDSQARNRFAGARQAAVACGLPMCGPSSGLQNINYTNMSREEVKQKLRDAMAQLKCALDMCLRQCRAGRCFVFEHPTASLWATAMMRHMMGLEGVYTAKLEPASSERRPSRLPGRSRRQRNAPR